MLSIRSRNRNKSLFSSRTDRFLIIPNVFAPVDRALLIPDPDPPDPDAPSPALLDPQLQFQSLQFPLPPTD